MRWILFIPFILADLFLGYLCLRWKLPRIPDQLRVYRVVPFSSLVCTVLLTALLTWLGYLALAQGVLIPVPVLLLVKGLLLWLLMTGVPQAFAFSEEHIALRGLSGPMRLYRWEELSACTVARRELRGRGLTHPYDEYRLTLPDCTLTLSGAEDAGIEFLQVLARRRPDLPITPESPRRPDQGGSA